MRAACSGATRGAGAGAGARLGGSSPGDGGWVTDTRWEDREPFAGSDGDEEDSSPLRLRRGTLVNASRPRLAGTLVFLTTTTAGASSDEAPARTTGTAAAGTPFAAPETTGAAPTPSLSRREAAADDDAADREGGCSPFAAPPRFLLAIPPGLADEATAPAPAVASGTAGTVGGEGLLPEEAEELSPEAAAVPGPPLPRPPAGVPRGRAKDDATTGGLALVRRTSGADALLASGGPAGAAGAASPAPPAEGEATATLGAGSQ